MIHLTLYSFKDQASLDLVRQLDTKHELRIDPRACFWLGSVGRDDEDAVKRFLALASAGDVLELNKHVSMADDLTYAILIQDAAAKTNFHLFIMEVDRAFGASPRVIYGKRLPSEYSVHERPGKDLPTNATADPKKVFWKSFFEALVPFSKRRRNSQFKTKDSNGA